MVVNSHVCTCTYIQYYMRGAWRGLQRNLAMQDVTKEKWEERRKERSPKKKWSTLFGKGDELGTQENGKETAEKRIDFTG